ncbi:helix-turn-helix domain-containing protein [Kribbella sp. CA-253562]|uniref:helix-turn-helix domain-containing protein n=1 Tax=Kribbella sp. CA-253562 TaxID=3239942 RepID=UPI003D8D1932
MNEALRRAMYAAGLSEEDIAARLGVDPKTVGRWVDGRLPFPRHRGPLARLLSLEEPELWPELLTLQGARRTSGEVVAVYPQRNLVTREAWNDLFQSAEHQIDILAYAALFLAEDKRLVGLLASKATAGIPVNLALGNPKSPAVVQRGKAEKIGGALPSKIRNALVQFGPLLERPGVSLRLHDTVLYNSMYRVDDQLLVNQHVFGLPAAQAPVYHLRRLEGGEMFDLYMESFAEVWKAARPVDGVPD